MAESIIKSYFPSQVVSDLEKQSPEYGLQVGKAIEHEWFDLDGGITRHSSNFNEFHQRRLYARGEQSVRKYKDELAIDGDLSYLNIDWSIVPIIPKFVDIVVNGMDNRTYDIKARSQDPSGLDKRTKYMESILRDMQTRELNDFAEQAFGVNLYENNPEMLPSTVEELELRMQLSYKEGIEVAEEQALNVVFNGNKYDLIKRRLIYDLVSLGICAAKNTFTQSEGIKVEYVDPANIVYSHTESPYFDDIYYAGEVKTIPINELKREFPGLEQEDLEEIEKQGIQYKGHRRRMSTRNNELDKNMVQVLYFNYKTYANEVYKLKETATGLSKVIIKDDTFNPPEGKYEGFEKVSRSIEVLYEGVLVLGTKKLLKWEIAKNMMRPKSDFTRVKMNYSICAPRMYEGRIESLVSRIMGFGDMIQLTHMKFQQVLSRMVPDGIYLDADGLSAIDLGNGTNYNPAEALKMFMQTGSVVGRSYTQDGEFNHAKIPIQEIQTGVGNNKIPALIQTYNFYLQMIRDATGLNEAVSDAPDKDSLVGLQKMAAANSNTATRHILKSFLYITSDLCEGVSLRISDVLEYSPTRDAFIQKIGAHNVAALDEIQDLHLHDFAIFIDLTPDDEEKAVLEQNIQMALNRDQIDLDDAIDIREIKNLKLANQMLKLRKKKKQERDMQIQQANIQAQEESNIRTQQASAQLEVQKEQAKSQAQSQHTQVEHNLDMQKMDKEAALKKGLMDHEFAINMRLKEMEADIYKKKEGFKEDRKDKRTKIQASQQSELIEQRQRNTGSKDFESSGNDTMDGGFNLGSLNPGNYNNVDLYNILS